MHTLLVVEDDPLLRRLIGTALSADGRTILEAPTIAAAKALLAQRSVDLVITDMGLPDGEGSTLIQWMRSMESLEKTPVVAISGRAETPKVNAAAILRKPVPVEDLKATCNQLLPPIGQEQPPRRVLVVDDSPEQAALLAARLERHGFEVLLTNDAKRALDIAEREQPDAIVSDVVMPGLDGFGLCSAIRIHETLKNMPVILVTALSVEGPDRTLALRVGANDIVPRTPALDELVVSLSALPERHELQADPVEALAAYPERLREQLVAELDRRHDQEQEILLLESRLSAVASITECISRSKPGPFDLRFVLARYLDASDLDLCAVYLKTAGEVHHLAHASGAYHLPAEVAEFFGHAHLLEDASRQDDTPTDLCDLLGDAGSVLRTSGLARIVLLPLVVAGRVIGVAAYGFSHAPGPAPMSFVRAMHAPLLLLTLLHKADEVTGITLVEKP